MSRLIPTSNGEGRDVHEFMVRGELGCDFDIKKMFFFFFPFFSFSLTLLFFFFFLPLALFPISSTASQLARVGRKCARKKGVLRMKSKNKK